VKNVGVKFILAYAQWQFRDEDLTKKPISRQRAPKKWRPS